MNWCFLSFWMTFGRVILFAFVAFEGMSLGETELPLPPVAKRIPHSETHFGDTIVDEYYWMSNRSDPDVLSYIQAERKYCDQVLNITVSSLQQELYEEYISTEPQGDLTIPTVRGNYLYYAKPGTEGFDVWMRRQIGSEVEEVVIDEYALYASMGSDFFSIGMLSPSNDNTIVAYNIDLTGDERFTLYFKNMTDNTTLPENITSTFYTVSWSEDSTVVFYTKITYLEVQPLEAWMHVLGTPVEEDKLVYNETDPTFELELETTNSGEFIVLYSTGIAFNEVRYVPAATPYEEFELLYPRTVGILNYIEHHGEYFFIQTTTANAENYRIVRVPVNDTSYENWEEVVPHNPAVLIMSIRAFARNLVVENLSSALQHLKVYNIFQFSESYEIPLPGNEYYQVTVPWSADTYIAELSFSYNSFVFSYTSFVTPDEFYTFDFATKKMTRTSALTVPGFDHARYQTSRIYVPADDNQQIPVTMVYSQSLRKKEGNPLWLYGYGAYGDTRFPAFDHTVLSMLDRGVIYVLAHIRGGAMKGNQWYHQGKLLFKKNTFTDFITVAEYLIANGYTTKDMLAFEGVSAGGLLMGAVTTMRPDLPKAVYARVPFVDVLNTMFDPSISLTVQEYWEWGNPNNETFYWYMKSYSPYNNVKNTSYPYMMLTSGWNDGRVNYWEPTKMTANLRYYKKDTNLVLLYTTNAGHDGTSGEDYYYDKSYQVAFILDKILPPASSNGSSVWVIVLGVSSSLVGVAALVAAAVVWWQRRRKRQLYDQLPK